MLGIFLRSFVVLSLSLLGLCAPSRTSRVEHKVKEVVSAPFGWRKGASAPPDHILELRIGLPQPNFSELEKHLYEISDPFNERYGQHLSKEEVEELAAPHSGSILAVNEWLRSHGLTEDHFSRSSAKDWVIVRVPVSVAEAMLDTVRFEKTLWRSSDIASEISYLDS